MVNYQPTNDLPVHCTAPNTEYHTTGTICIYNRHFSTERSQFHSSTFTFNEVSPTHKFTNSSKSYISVTTRKQRNNMQYFAVENWTTEMQGVNTTVLMAIRYGFNDLRQRLYRKFNYEIISFLFRALRTGLATISSVSEMKLPFLSAILMLSSLPGVLAGCQIGIDEITQSASAILNQISVQTLILSIGATFGGSQAFANDRGLAIGLLHIGVAGINGIHAASKLFSDQEEFEIGVTDNEIEDRPPGKREYAGLIARTLRLYSTSVIFMVIGMMTCHIVFFGWLSILLLTTAIVALGEAYAPVGILVIYRNDDGLFYRWREDGTSAVAWRYTLTTSGNIIIPNNSAQSTILDGRSEPSLDSDWYRFHLIKWVGSYLAAALSFGTWVWWLFSLQLLVPWSWAPTATVAANIFVLLLAEWCDSIDYKDISYGVSKRIVATRRKICELHSMFTASSVIDHVSAGDKIWLTKAMVESLVGTGDLSSAKFKYRIARSLGSDEVIGTKFSDIYNMATKVSNVLQHEKDRLEIAGNSWPHLRVAEWMTAWTIELGMHTTDCNIHESVLQNYYQLGIGPTSNVLRACAAMSHTSCEVIKRFRREADQVWRSQLWKLAALAQICANTHPLLAVRASNCDPGNHNQAIKLWSEYLFCHQDWDSCITLLIMFHKLYVSDAIGYGVYNAASMSAERLMGCRYDITYENVIIWYGNRMVELNRDLPLPLAAPPRFATIGMLLQITESALMAEKALVSYLRVYAPNMLSMHGIHALLDVPNYSTVVELNDSLYRENRNSSHSLPPSPTESKENDKPE